jgi:hypothetical protein
MKYDKINKDVWFRESDHVYGNIKDPSIKYISVTTLIGKYENEFDKEFVSKYKALERILPSDVWKREKGNLWKTHKIPKDFLEVYNVSESELNKVQQDILDEWAEKNRVSCERGTAIHAKLENSFYKASDGISLKKFGIGGKFLCKKDYSELDLQYGVYPEYLVYYDNDKIGLHIAGQIDLLVKDGDDIIIGDWKTNEKLDAKGFFNSATRSTKKMKYPLNNIEDCNLWHYYLQLSTYAWMLQKINPDFNIKRLFIYHFDHDNNQKLYEVPYLKGDVERMLKHFAKQQKIEKQRSKYARIEY